MDGKTRARDAEAASLPQTRPCDLLVKGTRRLPSSLKTSFDRIGKFDPLGSLEPTKFDPQRNQRKLESIEAIGTVEVALADSERERPIASDRCGGLADPRKAKRRARFFKSLSVFEKAWRCLKRQGIYFYCKLPISGGLRIDRQALPTADATAVPNVRRPKSPKRGVGKLGAVLHAEGTQATAVSAESFQLGSWVCVELAFDGAEAPPTAGKRRNARTFRRKSRPPTLRAQWYE